MQSILNLVRLCVEWVTLRVEQPLIDETLVKYSLVFKFMHSTVFCCHLLCFPISNCSIMFLDYSNTKIHLSPAIYKNTKLFL